jgi:hypothetical protein
MHDCILDQPTAVRRVLESQETPARQLAERVATARRVHLVGTGTSWHAALVGEHLLRSVGGRDDARAWNSFEFWAYPPRLTMDDLVTPAQDARKKLSWWALQRRGRRVACSPDGYARSALPARAAVFPADPGADPTPSASYEALDPAVATDNTFVIEFRTNRYASYVYLIAVDAISTATAEVWVWVPGGTQVQVVPAIPDATPASSTLWPEPEFFPAETVDNAWRRQLEGWSTGGIGVVARYQLSAGDDPILLLSSERLSFGVIGV